jgi:superfamily I DNA and/or RNA helicase
LSNKLFYDNKLKNGVSEKDRDPLIDGMPPLMIIDTIGKENFSQFSNSTFNEQEIKVVSHLAEMFINSGIQPTDIGIIALCKGNPHSNTIQTTLKLSKSLQS